jgi:hypothetical protein
MKVSSASIWPEFVEVPGMESEPQPVHHVPSGLLANAKVAADFVVLHGPEGHNLG